jgi:hypothetical protein
MFIYRDGQHDIHQPQRTLQKLPMLLDDLVAVGKEVADQENSGCPCQRTAQRRLGLCLRGEITAIPCWVMPHTE